MKGLKALAKMDLKSGKWNPGMTGKAMMMDEKDTAKKKTKKRKVKRSIAVSAIGG